MERVAIITAVRGNIYSFIAYYYFENFVGRSELTMQIGDVV